MASGRGEAARTTELVGRRLDTRINLVEAARRVFQRLGYEPTTVAEIVAEARVSRATFYLYFTGKQEIYRAIGEELVAELTERFRELDRVIGSGSRDDLRKWFVGHVEWSRANHREYAVWSEADVLEPEVATAVWRGAVANWLDAMPNFAGQWPPRRRHEAFTRLALLVGQFQFFHHSLLDSAEQRIAIDILTDAWLPLLRPSPASNPS